MKPLLVLMIFLVPVGAIAQRYQTVELKPITKQGWRYYYDLKKVRSPLALEIPLTALNDEEITRNYKASKAYQDVAAFVSVVPLVYLFTASSSGGYIPEGFWIIIGGTLATQIGLIAISHNKLGKAIDRYNTLIFKPSSSSIGLEMVWRF